MKKLLSALLVLMFVLSAVAMTATAETEGGTVRMLVNVTGGKDEEENVLWAQALGEATGLTIELEKPASDYGNVLMQKLSAGESYDLIYIDASQYANLVDQGALTDITDYIENSEILFNNVPESEWEDLRVDGRIYAGFNKRELHILVNLNKVMLEEAGIDYTQIEPTLDGAARGESVRGLLSVQHDPQRELGSAALDGLSGPEGRRRGRRGRRPDLRPLRHRRGRAGLGLAEEAL